MYCPNCGTKADDDAVFCRNCGTNLRPQSPVYTPPQNPVQGGRYEQRPSRQPVYDPSRIPSAQPVYQQPRQPSQQPVYQPPKPPASRPVYTPPQKPATPPVPPQPVPAAAQPRENVLMGALGALLGALVGCLSILLFDKLGVVAAASGIILVVCTFLGYGKLGKKVGPVGVVICLALIAVTPYVAARLIWAIAVGENFGGSLISNFLELDFYLRSLGVVDDFNESLGTVYLYTFIGVAISGFSMLRSGKSGKKNKKK